MWNRISTIVVVLLVILSLGYSAGAIDVSSKVIQAQPTAIDSCTTITESGRYVLTQDVENATDDTCIEIRTSDVVLNGNGHTIDGDQNASTFNAFQNATNETGTHPDMPDWKNIGITVNASGSLSNVTVQQLTVTDWFFGVYYNNVTQGTIQNVTISGSGDGLSLYDTTEILVTDNTLEENIGTAFIGDGVNSTEFRSNAVESNADGVLFYNSVRNRTGFVGYDGPVTNNAIVNNTIRSNGLDGVFIDTGQNNSIIENTISNNEFNGILVSYNSNDNTIAGNQLSGNGHSGIALAVNSSRNRLVDNVITNTTGADELSAAYGYAAGIVLNESSDNLIRNTTIRNSTNWAYYSANGARNNTVNGLTIDEMRVSFTGADVALARTDNGDAAPRDRVQSRFGGGLLVANTRQNATIEQLQIEWLAGQPRTETGERTTMPEPSATTAETTMVENETETPTIEQ